MLFALIHFRVLHPIITTHLTCVFPSLANDTNIIGPSLDVLFVFLQLHEEFGTLGLLVQPMKCVA